MARDDKGKIRGVLIETLDGTNFVFDATTQSTHTLQAEITSNPIESNKGNITDHRRTKPGTWAFTAVLVDEADPSAANDRGSASTISIVGDSLESARDNGPQITHKALDSLAFLQELFASSDVVRITTDAGKLDNQTLETLTYRVVASLPLPGGFTPEASVIEVSGSFRTVRFASTEIVAVPKDAVKKKQGKILIYGPPAPETAPPATTDKSKSILEQLLGF